MRKSLVVVGILTILVSAMSFGVMVGFTYNTTGYGAVSVGTELGQNTFAYAGISFPLGVTVGGGMKMGTIFTKDFGKSEKEKNIGILSISWGGLASAGMNFAYITSFGIFAGPAIFFDWNSDFIEGNVMWYTGLGFSFSTGWNSGLTFDTTSGIFYRF